MTSETFLHIILAIQSVIIVIAVIMLNSVFGRIRELNNHIDFSRRFLQKEIDELKELKKGDL